jgi:hypothetical protein
MGSNGALATRRATAAARTARESAAAATRSRVLRPLPVAGLISGRAEGDESRSPITDQVDPGASAPSPLGRLRRIAGRFSEAPIRRYFPPPPLGLALQPSKYGNNYIAHVTKSGGKQPNQMVPKLGWSIDKEKAAAVEIANNGAVSHGVKTTRLTVLMTPGHAKILAGGGTVQNYDPIGWEWIKANEVRSARRARISHWVRFHLLNAELGGKGVNVFHLIPADQSANGKWRTQIEADMKVWVKKAPVWYDVQVTYYTQAEAPGTYAPGPNQLIDYRPNIALFPKVIHADWKTFDTLKGQWMDMPPCTVQSGFPAAPGQRETELIGAQNLSALASIYQIHYDVLDLLSRVGQKFTTYAQVRRLLENWAAQSTNSSQYEARMDRIAASDPYLRTALTGGGNRKLKIHGVFVPDDQTPEAKYYVSPANVKSASDLNEFVKVTSAIKGGYYHAQQTSKGIPTAEQFFHSYVRNGPIGNVKLATLQADWDDFVASNDALPPMLHTDFAPDGREIFTLVVADFIKTVPPALHTHYKNQVGARTAVDNLRDQVTAHLPQFVQHNVGNLRFTVYGTESEEIQAVRADPQVKTWTDEMDFRVKWFQHLSGKGLLARCQHDFLGAPITDFTIMNQVKSWYEQTKQQQVTTPPTVKPAQTTGPFYAFGGSQSMPHAHPQPSVYTAPTTAPFGGPGMNVPVSQVHPQPVGRPYGSTTFGNQTITPPTTGQAPIRFDQPTQLGQSVQGMDIDIHPANRKVIDRIEHLCAQARSTGQVLKQHRIEIVLDSWRKSSYAGMGDIDQDVLRAMNYIQS